MIAVLLSAASCSWVRLRIGDTVATGTGGRCVVTSLDPVLVLTCDNGPCPCLGLSPNECHHHSRTSVPISGLGADTPVTNSAPVDGRGAR